MGMRSSRKSAPGVYVPSPSTDRGPSQQKQPSARERLAALKKEEAELFGKPAAKTADTKKKSETQSASKQEESQNFLQNFMGGIDDAYMGFMRDHVLGLPKQGVLDSKDPDVFMAGPRNFMGQIFAARPGAKGVNPQYQYEGNNAGDVAGIFANRALHAGGITAAGAGLYELGGAIAGQFGGPADQQTPQQIRM